MRDAPSFKVAALSSKLVSYIIISFTTAPPLRLQPAPFCGVVCTARGGKVQDPMGDAASNIGRAGHNQRHAAVLKRLVQCMQSVWGKLVEMEPQDHLGYSNDYRPDLTARGLGAGGKRLVGDVKFKDPLSSNPEEH